MASQPCEQSRVHFRKKMAGFSATSRQLYQLGIGQLAEGLNKREQKPGKKPGKYICHYCGRACAKPSVLKKHIRSHTGERPYPCVPCGFSFKTKSNLYKHRKSHTHAVKAGLLALSEKDAHPSGMDQELLAAEGEMQSDAEQTTDTDEEGSEDLFLDCVSSFEGTEGKWTKESPGIPSVKVTTPSATRKEIMSESGKVSLSRFREMRATPSITEVEQAVESCTIKQKLALRLSEKRSQDSEHSLSLPSSSSKGSTDSGYFSRSESAEQQHTNSVSRMGSIERHGESESHPRDKSPQTMAEQSDVKTIKRETQMNVPFSSSQFKDIKSSQPGSEPRKLTGQPSIQVPEIRVTEEPDRSPKPAEVQVKHRDKPVEEFQWPQRSETLSQFPVEKLPPKKKRIRLADLEYSSGDSSFESACTSLSRSPSQDSNLSHSSSFSLSLDRDEGLVSAPVTKLDEYGKPLEFLSVPGSGHTLSIPGEHRQKEMRRSASEQAPFISAAELPDLRSKSFDYGSLSPTSRSRQGESYASGVKQRRRGYLVRQASLSVDPETSTQEKSVDISAKQDSESMYHNPSSVSDSSATRSSKISTDLEHPGYIQASSPEGAVEMQTGTPSPDKQLLHGHETIPYSFIPRNLASLLPATSGHFWKPDPLHILPWHQLQDLQTRQLHLQSKESVYSQAKTPMDAKSPTEDLSKSLKRVTSATHVSSEAHLAPVPPNLQSLQSPSASLVPVRIQMQVPSHGSITYSSLSQIFDSQTRNIGSSLVFCGAASQGSLASIAMMQGIGFDITQVSGQPSGLLYNPELSPARLKTGIPLSLTSKTISTTEAPSGGRVKRMLSPASSIDLFMESKQQKRVKEEKMYGQIVAELSAVELGNPDISQHKDTIKEERTQRGISPSLSDISSSSMSDIQSQLQDKPMISPLKFRYSSDGGTESPQNIDVDEPEQDSRPPSDTTLAISLGQEVSDVQKLIASHGFGAAMLLADFANAQLFSKFPSLHTTTCVSWCYLHSTKPNSALAAPLFSVYATWCVRSFDPNPPNLATKTTLALLHTKQKKHSDIYTIAAAYQPGILVSSLLWKQRFGELQGKPDLGEEEMMTYKRAVKGIRSGNKNVMEDHKEETPPKQPEPTRIKIFEGGFKSTEDYVYVRGRGRGKYICEECGIRCKKPSMLKKHIRTHTDIRPYECKSCHFAFKTKGNLTKHMKSKAHMKKCLELGVSFTSIDSIDDADNSEDILRATGKSRSMGSAIKHQFSDVDDSDGADDDGDEIDEDDDDDDDEDGSTPRTRSRSTSPLPCAINSPHFPSYLSQLPSIQVHPSACSRERDAHIRQGGEAASELQSRLSEQRPGDDDSVAMSSRHGSMSFHSNTSYLLSLPRDVSLTPQRSLALTPHRSPSPRGRGDCSPQGGLSPRADSTSLRAVSPKRDVCFGRDSSPLQHLSPGSLCRALSPGHEGAMRRELSPRGRQRGMLRAVSPRRGSQHSRAPWEQGRGARLDTSPHGRSATLLSHSGIEAHKHSTLQPLHLPSGDTPIRGQLSGGHADLFSHLPLHSQQQARPLPLMPVGGIQMLPARAPAAATPHPSSSPQQSPVAEESGASPPSAPMNDLEMEPPGQQGATALSPQDSDRRDREAAPSSSGEAQSEESVQTCTEAIASLRITAEEKSAKS
ncbi:human immunodeficiency virus type I enhancer-binding protein 2 homolog [Sardina pilchardus]|uniref:human immunodeficiency virus type I enhancer-binding protein 2 homolog n=1 Tax=Sardina pilchardus TaxID=27697 RepID=UPI002E15D90C